MHNPAVLIVEDDDNLREALYDTLRAAERTVVTADSGPSALDILNREDIGLVISDLQMDPMDGAELLGRIRESHPCLPAVLMTAHGTIENAVKVMQDGAADYLVKPFAADDLKAIVDKYLKPVASDVIAVDPASQDLLRIAERVAATEATVTISGESGCGKEVVARFIHDRSPRSEQSFVAINCAAIPENMLEAVLFGYEKGAFTGATAAHAGKFEQADHGTLLLDEISEMDLALQAKLLRVLQEREIERIGGRAAKKLDVRVLATTNRDLREDVANGRFREDLFYRLNVFPLHIPPLRERRQDILPLAYLALRRHVASGAAALSMTPAAEQALVEHDWPGNVRELENLMQRTAILMHGHEIDIADLAFENVTAPVNDKSSDADLQQALVDREYQLIHDALVASGGKRAAVAKKLGISPRTLRYKLARMREAGISIPGDNDE